jgi:hypothetical protein
MPYKAGDEVIVTSEGVNKVGVVLDRRVINKSSVYDILLENGDSLLLETYTITPLVNENFTVNNDIAAADNETFTTEADNVLDFSERNPFGEAYR